MAIKYLDAKRLQGTNAERLALTSFPDSLGSSADGTNIGTSPTSAETAINGVTSLDFNGTSQIVSVPNTGLTGLDSWSISCWIYPDTNASEAFMGIWSTTASNKVFGIERQSLGTLNFTVTVGTTNYNISGETPATTDSKWNHLVFVKDGTTLRAYVDNVATPTEIVASGSNDSPDQPFTIGDRWESSSVDFDPFNGKFQEVAFWNRAITTTEINEIFNGYDQDSATSSGNTGLKISETLSTTKSGVLGYWSLDSITPDNQPKVYPSLPNGTIFNETDAYKYFMWNGTDTWNQMVSS